MTTAATKNPHEEANRASKVLNLSIALDQALTLAQVPLCSARALAYVEALDDDGWKRAARNARRPPPSETTREMVREVYRKRAEHDAGARRLDNMDAVRNRAAGLQWVP